MSKEGSDLPEGWPWPRTAGVDPRFPNVNQTSRCFIMYVDYQKCTRLLGQSYEPCGIFKRIFQSICPISWVEKWDQQIEDGTFAGVLPEPQEDAT